MRRQKRSYLESVHDEYLIVLVDDDLVACADPSAEYIRCTLRI